jgi:hypothetical protein
VVNVKAKKPRVHLPLFIHNKSKWLMCTLGIQRGMHPVV